MAIRFSVADMRQAAAHHREHFDLVIACDNAVPHLLTDEELLPTFEQLLACTRPGGGSLITVRDYDREDRAGIQVKPYGVRDEDGVRHFLCQVWEFRGGPDCTTRVMRSRYYAVGTDRLMELMRKAGFVQWSGSTAASTSRSFWGGGAPNHPLQLPRIALRHEGAGPAVRLDAEDALPRATFRLLLVLTDRYLVALDELGADAERERACLYHGPGVPETPRRFAPPPLISREARRASGFGSEWAGFGAPPRHSRVTPAPIR